MKPDERIKRRVKKLFDCRNMAEISRRTGFPQSTLASWRREPLRIRAVDLETLEDLLLITKDPLADGSK